MGVLFVSYNNNNYYYLRFETFIIDKHTLDASTNLGMYVLAITSFFEVCKNKLSVFPVKLVFLELNIFA